MPKSSNQKIKLLYLLRLLWERTDEEHGLSTDELIAGLAEYGVKAERKALYDDLEVLRLFGLDIEMRRERTVRYHLLSRTFELPELKLLVDAVQSSKFITHKKSNELIKKLESFASCYEARQLQRQVFVSNRIKTMNESIYYTVDGLHTAMNKNEKISFQYYDWSPKKEKLLRRGGKVYTVSPWALTWEDENYYLIAYDEGRIKHFRVDKMTNLSPSDEKRDGSELFKNWDMALYSKKTFGMYGGREENVTLRCGNELAGVMIDRFGTEPSFIPDGDGYFRLSVKVYVSPQFLSWLISLGDGVTLLSPDSVIEELLVLAGSVIGKYE